MIATDKRKAIFLLHQEGMHAREIARKLGVSRNTVRSIIQQRGELPPRVRSDKQRWMKICCASFITSARAGSCACMKSWWRSKPLRCATRP